MLAITSKERYERCAPTDDPDDPDAPAVLGTVEDARNAGFLCVISLLSTLRRLFVTSEPRLSSANTAATPPAGAAAGAVDRAGGGGGPGGGGGGGGGGAPPAAAEGGAAALYSEMDMPYNIVVYQPMHGWETRKFACLRIPDKARSMVFHHVLLHIVEDGSECSNPFDVRLIPAQEE
jgi:hypothetical protein